MRTYRRKQYPRNGRVSEGPAGGEGVCGRPRRSGDDAAVRLDDRKELGVAVEFKVGNIGGGAAVYHQLVEDFELCTFDGFVGDRGGDGRGGKRVGTRAAGR